MPKDLVLILPDRIYDMLEKIERKSGYRKEDLIMRAVVKVIEEFGGANLESSG